MSLEKALPDDEGRGWTVQKIIDFLNQIIYFERASAHILAGWNPKIPEMNVKVMCGQHLFQDMDNAAVLRNRNKALTMLEEKKSLTIPEGWRTVMVRIDSAKNTAQMLTGLYFVIKHHVTELYELFLANTDPISDAPSIRLISRILPEKIRQVLWAEKAMEHLNSESCSIGNRDIWKEEVEILWNCRHTKKQLIPTESIWNPLDRVTNVVRPSNMKRGEPGSLRIIPIDALRNPKDIGIFLHGFLNEEFTTMELVCRNTYEHPEMPWEFHLDMARHAADEARHAQMIEKLASDYSVKYGDYPIYTYSYEGLYEFDPCERYSKRELLWRMLLRNTLHEGLALDSLAFEIKKRRFLDQNELARVFSFLLADEVFHAQSGLKWSRFLCDGDLEETTQERAKAHEYFIDTLRLRRAKYVAHNIERAEAEVDILEEASKHYELPFHRILNVQARKEAGFTQEEIEQVINWEYVDPS
ncbi:MAG: DUF455 family protein [Nitrososphaeraceae archaeon]